MSHMHLRPVDGGGGGWVGGVHGVHSPPQQLN